MDARSEFNRIFGDVVMSDNDAAWYIFKAGWNAARASEQYPHPLTCICLECQRAAMTKAWNPDQNKPSIWRKRQVREIED
jgi:hypothetical protein